jgi:hypothetical protein
MTSNGMKVDEKERKFTQLTDTHTTNTDWQIIICFGS